MTKFYKLASVKESRDLSASVRRQHAPQDTSKRDYSLLIRRVDSASLAVTGAEQTNIDQALGSLYHACLRYDLPKVAATVNAVSLMTGRNEAYTTLEAIRKHFARMQTQQCARLAATLANMRQTA